MKRWAVAWGPAATWAAVLFLVSSQPTLPVDLSSGLDKFAHFGAYLVFGFLATFGATFSRASLWVAGAVCWGYALSDELHQSFVPGRDASIGDWFADAAGSIAGILLYLLFLRLLGTAHPRTDLGDARTT